MIIISIPYYLCRTLFFAIKFGYMYDWRGEIPVPLYNLSALSYDFVFPVLAVSHFQGSTKRRKKTLLNVQVYSEHILQNLMLMGTKSKLQ